MGNVTTCLFKDQAEKTQLFLFLFFFFRRPDSHSRSRKTDKELYTNLPPNLSLLSIIQPGTEQLRVKVGLEKLLFLSCIHVPPWLAKAEKSKLFSKSHQSVRQASESPMKVSHLRDLTSTGNGIGVTPFVLFVVHTTPLPIPHVSSSLSPLRG